MNINDFLSKCIVNTNYVFIYSDGAQFNKKIELLKSRAGCYIKGYAAKFNNLKSISKYYSSMVIKDFAIDNNNIYILV